MELGLAGKVAVVSAASRGIGHACALALAREGAKVAIFARDQARLKHAADEVARVAGTTPFTCVADLFDADAIRQVFERVRQALGPVQVLVANSVGPQPGGFAIGTDEAWLKAFEGAFLSVARMIREAIPQMLEAGSGSVITVQSSSVKQPIPGLMLSNGVRPGVAGLTKSLTQEYASAGLRFNVVCPGRILTDRFRSVEASHGEDLEQRMARMAAEVPMKRLGQASEVVDAVAFLASDRASYITGTVLAVDGGNIRSLY